MRDCERPKRLHRLHGGGTVRRLGCGRAETVKWLIRRLKCGRAHAVGGRELWEGELNYKKGCTLGGAEL